LTYFVAGKKLTTAQRAFLEQPYVGIVTDLRPDGTPHSTVVWVDVDDEGVSINTAWPRAKPRRCPRRRIPPAPAAPTARRSPSAAGKGRRDVEARDTRINPAAARGDEAGDRATRR